MKGISEKYIKLFILLIVITVSTMSLASCSNKKDISDSLGQEQVVKEQRDKQLEFTDIKFDDIVKIGVIPNVSDKNKKSYVLKDEVLITDKNVLSTFASIAYKGKLEMIFFDRLPSEYILNLYFKNGECIRAYYWINSPTYNLTIEGVSGTITVDSKAMDNLIMKAAGEVGRIPNEDPY